MAILPTVGKKNLFFFKVHAIATVSSDDKLRQQSGVEQPNNETITCDTPDSRDKKMFFLSPHDSDLSSDDKVRRQRESGDLII